GPDDRGPGAADGVLRAGGPRRGAGNRRPRLERRREALRAPPGGLAARRPDPRFCAPPSASSGAVSGVL
ncbi:MAG: hypothetical protein AVDCRST_MAG34-3203, partial [uncultured Nocardioidaceae bacterium]